MYRRGHEQLVARCRISARWLRHRRPPHLTSLHRPLDQILDVNVRDGLVYYRALKSERGRLDRYVASLNVPGGDVRRLVARRADGVLGQRLQRVRAADGRRPLSDPRLRARVTRREHPPDSGRVRDAAPPRRGTHVTLDEIEKTILPEFKEPRLYLALGRGAVGSGRLRSEAYTGERLTQQLDDIQKEFVSEQTMLKIDRASRTRCR